MHGINIAGNFYIGVLSHCSQSVSGGSVDHKVGALRALASAGVPVFIHSPQLVHHNGSARRKEFRERPQGRSPAFWYLRVANALTHIERMSDPGSNPGSSSK